MGTYKLIELDPDRGDLFLDLRSRPADPMPIVRAVLEELKAHMQSPADHPFPKTIVWTRTLNDMSKFKKLSRKILGKYEYYPPYKSRTCRAYPNQAVALYWSGHDPDIKEHVLKQLLDPDGNVLLVFASPALSTGVDVAKFLRSIHIGLPSKLVHLFQSIGRIGRGIDGGIAIIFANGCDVPAGRGSSTEKQLSRFATGGTPAKSCHKCRGAICKCSCVRARLLAAFLTVYDPDEHPIGESCCSACASSPTMDDDEQRVDGDEQDVDEASTPWEPREYSNPEKKK